METIIVGLGVGLALVAGLTAAAYAVWRYWWFWRNPSRVIPLGDHFLSPADGTVVYVQRAAPGAPILVCKQGVTASINDIVREELSQPKILIGIFMSPFSVHYNRTPISGVLTHTRQYPAVRRNHHMGSMHWRTVCGRLPMFAHSPHIVENNRAVTRFEGRLRGAPTACYVVQIGGGSVHGIDVYPAIGQQVEQGEIFGMIRIGSQVDLIVPDLPGLEIRVQPGDRVLAGQTILVA
jgi:phosphatidylserine decarboxylase